MLLKLAFRNVKRSMKDYIIYLITVTLTFSFMFAFSLVANAQEILQLSEVMQNFKLTMYVANTFILFAVCFLINYTIKFMFYKRSKEFGLYMLLGIKKKKLSSLFTLENMILGLFSLTLSIPLGYLFSFVLSFIITQLFELNQLVNISFSFEALGMLGIYFIFCSKKNEKNENL